MPNSSIATALISWRGPVASPKVLGQNFLANFHSCLKYNELPTATHAAKEKSEFGSGGAR